jgi:hypothetical protein
LEPVFDGVFVLEAVVVADFVCVDVTELEADFDAVCDGVAVIVPDLEAVFDGVFVFEGVVVADFV